jgi:acetylornithine/N-succinyldiaminopimelate aminotransferase
VSRALDHGLLINVTAGNTIRLLPPLIINEEQALELARGVAALIDTLEPA